MQAFLRTPNEGEGKGVLNTSKCGTGKTRGVIEFVKALRKAGFKAEEVQVFAHGNKGTRHTIWIAEKIKG